MVLGLGLGHADALWICALRGCSPVTASRAVAPAALPSTPTTYVVLG